MLNGRLDLHSVNLTVKSKNPYKKEKPYFRKIRLFDK